MHDVHSYWYPVLHVSLLMERLYQLMRDYLEHFSIQREHSVIRISWG